MPVMLLRYMSRMELNHLRRFYEVARAGGFTKAARAVRAQQPALSRAVSQLESELGVTLIDRGKRSITLTKVGREVYAACEEMFVAVGNIQTIVDAERRDLAGPVRFGVTSELSGDGIPEVSAAFVRAHPEVWPMAFVGPATSIIEEVVRGDLEFALFFHLPRVRPELSVEDLVDVPFRLVIAASSATDRACLESFVGSRETDDQATRSYPTLERLRAKYPKARIKHSSNDAAIRRALVLQRAGVAILPWSMIAADLEAERMVALLPEQSFRFPLKLVTRRSRRLSRVATEYLAEVRRWLAAVVEKEAVTRPKTPRSKRKRAS